MLPLAVMPLNCVVRSSGNPNVTFEKAFLFTLTTDMNLIEHLSRSLFLLPFSAALFGAQLKHQSIDLDFMIFNVLCDIVSQSDMTHHFFQ